MPCQQEHQAACSYLTGPEIREKETRVRSRTSLTPSDPLPPAKTDLF